MPDRIIREIPLIERYSRHNEAEDFRFRVKLKGHIDLSDKELDAIVRETADEIWKQIDCTTCANCCKTLQVVVDNKDIARLAARFNLSPRAFSKRYIRVAEDTTKIIASTPCPFLGEDNRCTVYEDRPKACRDFPYLHEDHFRSRSLGMIINASLCPIVFNVWQALKQRFKGGKRR